ncbi:MAG: VOC family protein [Firmicutes bacterium]|nr:VOC family protein [Bacillota bacterium]
MRFVHLAVSCGDFKEAETFASLFSGEEVASWDNGQGLAARLYKFGETVFEFLRREGKKGEGLHHIAFETEDVSGAVQALQERGAQLEQDFVNNRGQRIVFVTWNGTRIELLEEREEI